MDLDGTLLLQSDHPEMLRNSIAHRKPECAECHGSFDYVEQILERKTGTTEYRLKGQPMKLAAFAPVRFANVSWVIVVTAPYAEVTAFVKSNLRRALLLIAALGAAFTLAGRFLHQLNVAKVRAEEELRRSREKDVLEERTRRAEERYRTLFRQSPNGVLLIDPKTTLPIDFNEAAHRQLGYSRGEFARLAMSEYEISAPAMPQRDRVADLMEQGWEHYETRHRTKDGRIREVEVITQTVKVEEGTLFHCIHHDITDRKHAQQALEHRTAQLETLHKVNIGMTSEMEPAALYQTILGRAVGLFRGTSSGGLFLHRPERGLLELVIRTGQNSSSTPGLLKNGEDLAGRVWQSCEPLVVTDYLNWEHRTLPRELCGCGSAMGAPIHWNGQFVGVLELCSETPGFFTTDDSILMGLFATQAAVAVKNASLLAQVRRDAALQTTLLHDVNHRVKNNLLRLIEIIRLEHTRAAPSQDRLRGTLKDLETRLLGMEVVHTMLSTSRWNPLPLSELVSRTINAALNGSPIRDRIQVSLAVPEDSVMVIPEQATAVALILNELATNSVKYAWPSRECGHLEVQLELECRGALRPLVRLKYRDDGPGWPEDVLRGEASAVGMHLIQSSVRSPLRGDFAFHNQHGAVAELSFHLALPDQTAKPA